MEEVLAHSLNFYIPNTFNMAMFKKNTWTDWHLVPKEKPVISPGKPRISYVDFPLHNGKDNLEEYAFGDIYRDNCEGSWTFILMNDMETIPTFTKILNFLHGQTMNVTLYDDPSRTYSGVFTVESAQSNGDYASIVIHYSLDPIYTRN